MTKNDSSLSCVSNDTSIAKKSKFIRANKNNPQTVVIPKDKKVLAVSDIRKYLHVSPARIYRWINCEGLQPVPSIQGTKIYQKVLKEFLDKKGEFIIVNESQA